MFDKFSEAAEKLATGVSRRGFLGSVGRWAGATALGLAGVLTTAGAARAGTSKTCCVYYIYDPLTHKTYGCGTQCLKLGDPCPTWLQLRSGRTCPLGTSYSVTGCKDCGGP